MKIGVIGLGTIAQKAYLPLYTTRFSEHEWHFSTRSQDKLQELGRQYGLSPEQLHTSWRDLTEIVDAVCIHTPTHTHYEMVSYFLDHSIPVLIDKPLTEELDKTKELMKLAEEKQVPLMIGFNRRFAPKVKELTDVKDGNMLIVQKNQSYDPDFPVRYRIFDMMIHPIDTAVFLLNDQDIDVVDSEVIEDGGQFKRAWVMLRTKQMTALVSINNESGAKRESLELQSPSGTYTVEDLTELSIYTKEGRLAQTAGDWTGTLVKRGFEPMIQSFLETLEKKGAVPISLDSALVSHFICESICLKYEKEQ